MGNPINLAQTIGQIPTLQESIRLNINRNQIEPHAVTQYNRSDTERMNSTVVDIDESTFREVRGDESDESDGEATGKQTPAEGETPRLPDVDIVI